MLRRMYVAAITVVIAFSVFVPSVSAQAADAPPELCPTLPPAQPSVPDGPDVESALMQTASFTEESECAPGSMEFKIPMDVLIKLLESSGYDVVKHGIIDAVILDNDTMAFDLKMNQIVIFLLQLVILAMAVLMYRDRQRARNYLK